MRYLKWTKCLVATTALAMSPLTTVSAEVSEQALKSISIPDRVDTSIGTLGFFDGVPIDATVERVYDNLDRMRGVDVYLDNVGAVSINSVLDGLAQQGADAANKIAVFEQLMDSKTLVVTANTSTLYAYAGTDLAKDGPTVIEVPPGYARLSRRLVAAIRREYRRHRSRQRKGGQVPDTAAWLS